MSHTWLKHTDHGGVWACPDEAVDAFKARGWEPSDPPEQDDSHLYDRPPPKPEPTKAAKSADDPKKK